MAVGTQQPVVDVLLQRLEDRIGRVAAFLLAEQKPRDRLPKLWRQARGRRLWDALPAATSSMTTCARLRCRHAQGSHPAITKNAIVIATAIAVLVIMSSTEVRLAPTSKPQRRPAPMRT
jgi:hypothetical protein